VRRTGNFIGGDALDECYKYRTPEKKDIICKFYFKNIIKGHSNVILVQPVTRSQLKRQLTLFCFLVIIHMLLVNSNKDDVMNMLSIIAVVN